MEPQSFIEKPKKKINWKRISGNILVMLASVAITLAIVYFWNQNSGNSQKNPESPIVEKTEPKKDNLNTETKTTTATAATEKPELITLMHKRFDNGEALKELENANISPRVKKILVDETKRAIEAKKTFDNSGPIGEPYIGKIYGEYFWLMQMGHGGLYGPATANSRSVLSGEDKVGDIILLWSPVSGCSDFLKNKVPYEIISDADIEQCEKVDKLRAGM